VRTNQFNGVLLTGQERRHISGDFSDEATVDWQPETCPKTTLDRLPRPKGTSWDFYTDLNKRKKNTNARKILINRCNIHNKKSQWVKYIFLPLKGSYMSMQE
jgi:hypothetical protein